MAVMLDIDERPMSAKMRKKIRWAEDAPRVAETEHSHTEPSSGTERNGVAAKPVPKRTESH